MIKPIMKAEFFLAIPSAPATPADAQVAQDLLDTLEAHKHECVGMAANMIGVSKRVIVFEDEATGKHEIMYNPEIIERSGEFDVMEGCLSLVGKRPAKRYERITVRYQDLQFKERTAKYSGWAAQIIQHEVDHLSGIII